MAPARIALFLIARSARILGNLRRRGTRHASERSSTLH
jgi:hypothetical protein